MLQVILHQFPATHSVYHFHCRNWHNLPISLGELIDEVEEQIGYLCHLRLRPMNLIIYVVCVLLRVTSLIT